MATYVIGDVQGCHRTLMNLLDRIGVRPGSDRLWLAGDLVNRGPASLEVLRWAAGAGDSVTAVLGNHDLHLLARAAGRAPAKPRDTLDGILDAPDRDALLAWLRARPFVLVDGAHALVHAGLHPAWTVAGAVQLAAEASARVREGRDLAPLFHPHPLPRWSESLGPDERFRFAAAVFTRIRTVRADGVPCLGFSGPPEEAPPGCAPWYAAPGRRSTGTRVFFAHWAALGLHVAADVVGLDTGCVWGGTLTAFRLEDGRVFQEPLADRVAKAGG
jgi:bis(5'-nucleosyl)-tetraphosphatase (symmetrical)